MKYKSYSNYKKTDNMWIGNIPHDWNILKMKYLLDNISGGCWGKDIENNEGNIVLKSTEITLDGKWNIINPAKRTLTQTEIKNCLLKKGDLLVTKSSGSKKHIGKAALVTQDIEDLKCCFSNFMTRLHTNDKFLPKLMYYLLNSTIIKSQFNYMSNSTVGLSNLNDESFKNLLIPVTNIENQENIIKFLDKQTAKIDETISKNKKLIELLEEKRIALINQVVTKGLNPDVPMKDSGIEWIGEIPEHWSLTKFRNVLNERTEKNNPIKSKERLSLSIDKGVTLYSEKTTNLDRFKDDFTQYKLAHQGDLVLNSMNMIVGAVGVSKYFGCVSPVYYTYYDDTQNHTTTIYCDYLFKTKTIKKYLRSLGRGIMSIDRGDDRINTCRLKVSRDDLRNMIIPYPPLDEQKEINSYLNEECENIVKISTVIIKHINLLEEYKSSLIYHAVTGKIDVTTET